MKTIRIHKAVGKALQSLDVDLRRRLADALALLAAGESLGMPISRPMPTIESGAHELRMRDRTGNYRVFYYTKVKGVIAVFHVFKKKTHATPKKEIDVALKRLKEMV